MSLPKSPLHSPDRGVKRDWLYQEAARQVRFFLALLKMHTSHEMRLDKSAFFQKKQVTVTHLLTLG